jgi:two-component system NtrC family sensor kinase
MELGEGGDIFLVNRDGLFQTPPKDGEVLTASSLPQVPAFPDVREETVRKGRETVHQVTTWLNDSQWRLVVQQPEEEILAPVHRAVLEGGLVATLAMAMVFLATIIITSRLIRRIDQANLQRDQMYSDLMRSAKLASLGEMSAGLAHEINNPLAIISAEQTNLEDGLENLGIPGDSLAALRKSVHRCKRQVDRCGKITAKMLQFGRNTDTAVRPTETEPILRETGALLERHARANNATLQMELEPGIPPARLDPNELEQVLANLVNNAVDALGTGGIIRISARRDGGDLLLEVRDNGSGIAPDNLERVFHPFFTTKPVGKGTGLGLPVVHGIVRGWGGTIQIASQVGVGTTVSIRVPLVTESQPSGP